MRSVLERLVERLSRAAIVLGLVSSALAAPSAATVSPPRATTIPFVLLDNRIVVQVYINSAGPFSMIVDTGTGSLALTSSVARRLHLQTGSTSFVGGAGSGRAALSHARVDRLAIGALAFHTISADVLDLSPIQRAIGFPRLDGIIGYDVLREYRVGVDMDHDRLTLSAGPLAAHVGATKTPFTLDDDKLIRVQASVDGVHGTFIVDTGDRTALTLFRGFAAANDFYADAPVRDAVTGYGVGGPVYSDLMRTTVGALDATIENVLTRASRDRSGVFATSPEAGSIGNGLLKRFNLIYDYPDRQIIAWPSRYVATVDRNNSSSLWLSDGARPVVSAITPGGAAAKAGLQVGDAILAVDGTSTARWPLLRLRQWFASRPQGSTVSLTVRTPHGLVHRSLLVRDPTLPDAASAVTLPRHAVFGAGLAQKPAGVAVSFIVPNGPAAKAGLRPGDVIRSIGGVHVSSVAGFLGTIHDLAAGRRVTVVASRGRSPITFGVVLGVARDEDDAGMTTLYRAIVVDNTPRRTLLTLPSSAIGKSPAVLLIGGIGCFSVDVATNPQDPYLHLTHDLTRAGFATMRVEKSGLGDSRGPPCRNVDFNAEVRGYEAAFSALAHDQHVDPARIYLLGHSIGSVIAPRLALEHNVAGVIVMEGVGRAWPEYEIRNTRRELELAGVSPAAVDQSVIEKAQCMQRLLFEKEPEPQIEQSMSSCKVHNGVYPVTPAYAQQVAPLDIIEPWTKLKVPVLAVYGASDFVTELADHQRIVEVANAAHSGSATLEVVPAMSHFLSRAASPKVSYDDTNNGIAEPYNTDLTTVLHRWLCAREHCDSTAN